MSRTLLLHLPAVLLLGGCATTAERMAPAAVALAPGPAAGLDRVMARPAAALTALFGPPALDIREGKARKLQYRGPACVLDVYLYPAAAGDEPQARWIDARTARGADFDRASCIAALARFEPRRPAPPHRAR